MSSVEVFGTDEARKSNGSVVLAGRPSAGSAGHAESAAAYIHAAASSAHCHTVSISLDDAGAMDVSLSAVATSSQGDSDSDSDQWRRRSGIADPPTLVYNSGRKGGWERWSVVEKEVPPPPQVSRAGSELDNGRLSAWRFKTVTKARTSASEMFASLGKAVWRAETVSRGAPPSEPRHCYSDKTVTYRQCAHENRDRQSISPCPATTAAQDSWSLPNAGAASGARRTPPPPPPPPPPPLPLPYPPKVSELETDGAEAQNEQDDQQDDQPSRRHSPHALTCNDSWSMMPRASDLRADVRERPKWRQGRGIRVIVLQIV